MLELVCSVRGCGARLVRDPRTWKCARGHVFDVARSGYCNLLQPQDRRSRAPGDSKELVQARRALFDAGHAQALLAALIEVFEAHAPAPGSALLDAGCGEGSLLAELARRFALEGCGIDISVHAIDAAARRHRHVTWIVANADRVLPLADASLARVLSVDGRRNAREFRRVLAADGRLVVALPAADDQAELRAAVLGSAPALERFAKLERELEGSFALESRRCVRDRRRYDANALRDLLATTYRGARHSASAPLAALVEKGELTVTQSHELAVFRPV
jgi:23S rRNA (guanine745-N1)-methyltransferase